MIGRTANLMPAPTHDKSAAEPGTSGPRWGNAPGICVAVKATTTDEESSG